MAIARGKDMETVLDFCLRLCQKMLASGANLERVQLVIDRICYAYSLKDVSTFLLSGHVSLSVRDVDGMYTSRRGSVPKRAFHLQRLKQLNRLSYVVVAETPKPEELDAMLKKAETVPKTPDLFILAGKLLATGSLCLIFGGGPWEVVVVAAVTAVIHYMRILLSKTGMEAVVIGAMTMFMAASAAMLMLMAGVSDNGPVIMIAVSMLVFPGVALVNATRNLLCGNEMNGILQIAHILVDTLAMGVGMYVALWLFGRSGYIHDAVVTPLNHPVWLVILSFLSSVGFGIMFHVPPHDLVRAGIGGALARTVLLATAPYLGNRLLHVAVASFSAALYAEVLATRRKDPSTYFIYPAIIPLLPGANFYYMIVSLYLSDRALFESNAISCLQALVGLSVGFVLSSIVAHYVRRGRHSRIVRAALGETEK